MTAYQLFLKAVEGFTPGEVESVKAGRFCDSPKMCVARRYYLDLEMARMEDPSFLSRFYVPRVQPMVIA